MTGLLLWIVPAALAAAPAGASGHALQADEPKASLPVPAAVAALHPPIPLLDAQGEPVLESGRPISTMRSCANCHDTSYIAAHSYHVSLGRDERFTLGSVPGRRSWDYGPGAFGRWNPITYRYLSPPGDPRLDLSIADWIRNSGWRHVGGGPAVYGHGDVPLDARDGANNIAAEEPSDATFAQGVDPDRQVLDAVSRQPVAWDWQASGTVEMNCFLCHVENPDNAARIAMLHSGRFAWAGTATLASTAVVKSAENRWQYAADAFLPDGRVSPATLRLQEPTSENCGLCHGQTHANGQPLVLDLDTTQWSTATKGQVFSRQRMSDSTANLSGKEQLARPWDVHAAALLKCSSCHFSLNNPAAYEPTRRGRPEHLKFEPRRLGIGEYLHRPSHDFAKGHTTQGAVARYLDGTMRHCNDCHQAELTHDWLPYREAHFARLSCEACHISQTHAPALATVDWTMLGPAGKARTVWRGIEGDPADANALITGFKPVLLPREDLDGQQRLVPHNLVSSWFWVEQGDASRPVRLADLRAALFEGDTYHPEILAALDADGDGRLQDVELVLDEPKEVEAVRQRLIGSGVREPAIHAETQPYGLHHGVGHGATAVRRCEQCHAEESRLAEPMVLAQQVPGGQLPKMVGDSHVVAAGRLTYGTDGTLEYHPETSAASLYVLGHDRWPWVNWLGAISLVAVVLGATIHGTLRVRNARKRRADDVKAVASEAKAAPTTHQQPPAETDGEHNG